MSGIAAVFGSDRERRVYVHSALAAMPDRGSATRMAFDDPGATLGVTTHQWQERLSGGSVGACGPVAVIADATIYYRSDLTRALRTAGVSPRSQGAADLIAAAVAAWDHEAPDHLEGDFAYISWRRDAGSGHAARDPIGTRPLFFWRGPRASPWRRRPLRWSPLDLPRRS